MLVDLTQILGGRPDIIAMESRPAILLFQGRVGIDRAPGVMRGLDDI